MSRTRQWQRGPYAITDSRLGERLLDAVAQAIAGGAVVVQYRDKGGDTARRQHEATQLLALCRHRGVPLIINDDLALAVAVGADGIHLGREDVDLAAARRQLGPDAIIGISCYDSLARAQAAAIAGADYVAFGSFFPSSTKPQAVRAPITLLREARQQLTVPLVAIGGITPENGAALVAAGADLLAVVSGIFAAPDITAAARHYAMLYSPPP